MTSSLNRSCSMTLVAVLSMAASSFSEELVTYSDVTYDGTSYERAVKSFESDLNPAAQAKALKVLINLAVRGHYAEEIAELLVLEGQAMPVELFGDLDPAKEESLLCQLLENLGTEGHDESQDSLVTSDEVRLWKLVLKGIFRLAVPQKNVFEEAMTNPEHPLNVRILARIAVQHADVSTKKVEKLLETKPEVATTKIKQGDIVSVSLPAKAKDNQTGQESQAEFDFHTLVTEVLPDGNLQLEGRQTIQTDQGLVTVHVAGQARAEDIDEDRRVHSVKLSNFVFDGQQVKPALFSIQEFLKQVYQQLP